MYKGRRIGEIIISEAHSLLAHLGTSKTSVYIKDHLWWPNMVQEIKSYCKTCKTCARSKLANQKPFRLLNPLNVPSHPWEAIGIDFIGPLPESKDRNASYNSITVVIDLLTAMVHLVLSRTNYKASQVAELIFAEIYKHHSLPRNIVSDRDSLFTSNFWQELHRLIGVNLSMSSAYHPQTDGATEQANQTITQMIRACVTPDQSDWVPKLPGIKFAINSAHSETTGYAPFFLNSGRIPQTMIWNSPTDQGYLGVKKFAEQIKLALMDAHDSIIAAQVKQTRIANRHRRPARFEKDNLVYLSTENIKLAKGMAQKLCPKYIGPYKIAQDYNNGTYKISLPPELKQ
jgi:hypothetical protein